MSNVCVDRSSVCVKSADLPPGLSISPNKYSTCSSSPECVEKNSISISSVYPTIRMNQVSVSTEHVSRIGFVPYVHDPKINDYWLGIAVGRAWGNLTTIGGVYEPELDHNLLSTLYREVKEETNDCFQLPPPQNIGRWPVIYHKNTYTVLVEYPYSVMEHRMSPSEEINTIVWFTRRQLFRIHSMCRHVAKLRLSFSSYLEPIVLPLTCGVDLSEPWLSVPPPVDYLKLRPKKVSSDIGSYDDVLVDADNYRWYHVDVVLSEDKTRAWIANGGTKKYQVTGAELQSAVEAVKRVNNRAIKVYSESQIPGSQSLETEIRRWRKNDILADKYHDEYAATPDESKIDVIIKYEQLAYNCSRRSNPTDMSRINGIKFIDSVNRFLREGVNKLNVLQTLFYDSPWMECLTDSNIYTVIDNTVTVP